MGAPLKAATKPTETTKDRVGLRLFNAIIIYDDYVVAKSAEEARTTLQTGIIAGDVSPIEIVAKEVTMANSIRSSKTDDKPLVASDVTDEEFETLKGITNSAAFERFYERRS